MKLPFDFASKLLLRVVLPGALLAAMFWPVLMALKQWLGLHVSDELMVPVVIVLFGWLMLFLDMPLYMLAEGRRFWPAVLRDWGVARQAKRLLDLQTRRAATADRDRIEIDLEIRRFPLDRTGIPTALYPTRLGNLIHASELYPDRKYGVDGAFGWHRLWVSIDKDLRAELDDQQAIVDSALYACALAALAAVVCAVYAAVRGATGLAILAVLPSVPALLTLAAVALVACVALYRACLSAQAHYGELFCALFDQYLGKLDFDPLLKDLQAAQGDRRLAKASSRVRARAAIRFLKFHRYRPIGQNQNQDVRDW